MKDLDLETLLTRAQAAAELGVTTRTIDYHRVRGHLVPRIAKVGHGRGGTRVFFRRADIEDLKKPRVERITKEHS